jgi:hypothetical protein
MSVSTAKKAAVVAAGIAGLVGAAAQPAAAAPAETLAAPCVQKISVVNNGGFTANFQVVTREGVQSAPTDTYPINEWRIVDLTATPLTEGSDVRPLVHATAGDDVFGNVYVSYCANGQTATYTASGTTLDYQVTLLT